MTAVVSWYVQNKQVHRGASLTLLRFLIHYSFIVWKIPNLIFFLSISRVLIRFICWYLTQNTLSTRPKNRPFTKYISKSTKTLLYLNIDAEPILSTLHITCSPCIPGMEEIFLAVEIKYFELLPDRKYKQMSHSI